MPTNTCVIGMFSDLEINWSIVSDNRWIIIQKLSVLPSSQMILHFAADPITMLQGLYDDESLVKTAHDLEPLAGGDGIASRHYWAGMPRKLQLGYVLDWKLKPQEYFLPKS